MKQKDIDFLNKFLPAVAKHKVLSDEGEMTSVAFGGNCGIFALDTMLFLCNHEFPVDDWAIGFLFDADSLDEIYDDDNLDPPDLNHVLMKMDGRYFDGGGEADPKEWYGNLFDKDDDWKEILRIIQDFTEMSVTDDKLEKIMKMEWKKLGGDVLYTPPLK